MGIILVAYERESEQTALEQLLGSRGHQVLKAGNGLHALEMARRDPPHVVVSDIVLPRMDGFALCRKWKQDERLQSVPFIFYTRRHDDPKYERFALELGAERFLARTAQPEALLTAIEQLLANIPAEDTSVANPAAAAVDAAAVQRIVQQRTEQALASAQKRFDQVLAESQQRAEQAQARAIADLNAEHEQALARAIAKLQSEHQQALAQSERSAQQRLAAAKAEHDRALAQAQQALEQSQQELERLGAEVEALEISRERVAAGEVRFRRVFEANPLPMWIVDHATHGFIAVNDAALALYGYSRAEFLALTTVDLEGQAAHSAGEGVVAHKQKSGEPLFVALSSQQLEFDGRSADLVCAYDLTARLECERAQRASAQTTEVDSLGDGFLALNDEARIIDANVAYCRMTGYSREQLLGMNLSDVEQAGVVDTTARLQFLAMDGANRHETRHKRADGTLIDVEVTAGPVASGDERPMTMLVRDVTQRRRELARQRSQQRQLEFLVDLFKHSESFDESAIVRRVVDHAALATDSPLGYLYFVDSAHRTLTLASWRDRTQPQLTVSAAEPLPVAQADVLTECVKARRATVGNDAHWKPQAEGVPEVQRFVAVPVVDEDQTVAILGVANRDSDYGQDDVIALASLADGVWRMLQAKRAHAQTLSSLQRTDVALQGMIETLVRVSERHDPFTAGSSSRVAALAVALAREAGLDGRSQDAIRIAALLHDVGNVAVPAAILAKPGPLTEQELALMRTHAEEGCKLLADIDFGAPVADIILEHHERIDGSGYPRGLTGDDILIEARVLAIADTIEAICSPRPYRPALGMEAALDEINKNAGKLYDLDLVAACTRLVRQRGFVLPG
jgi:PAS domain S-box-containing protein/putative nucleotidyltransferase with HDIG domain